MKTKTKAGTSAPHVPDDLGDFTTTPRMVPIALLAILIGLFSSVVALVLLKMIAFFTNLFYYHRLSTELVSPAGHQLGVLAVLVPVVGGLIIGLMARYGSERIRGHGIPEAIEAILLRGSRVEPRVALLKPLSSAISIGSGGPFGAEGPIIMTGGAFGSMIAQLFHLTSAERKTLLVAGAAAGMSATFAAPVAATLLAVELLLFEWKPRSLVPVALASAAAAAARPYILGVGPLFPVPPHTELLGPAALLGCVAAGLLAGALSTLLTRAVYAAEDAFLRLPFHWMWWPAMGGLVVGLGGLVYPHALGVGYDTIEALLRGELVGRMLLVLIVVKGTIWAVSLGSGTSGGVLAPLLIMGAALGGLEAQVFPDMGVGFWPLISMGAILGGTMRSPFTGIIFALELTHDRGALLPLLIAVSIAHAFTVLVLRRSILTEKVSRRGFHLTREYATDPLEILFVREVMGAVIVVLPAGASREELASSLDGKHHRQRLFPIVDPQGDMLGVVTRGDLDTWASRRDGDDGTRTLADIARAPVTAFPDESLRVVVHRMAETGLTRMPVVERDDPRKMVGRIALEDLLKARVRHLEEERRRERPLPLRLIVPRWLRSRSAVPASTRSPAVETREGKAP